MRLRACLDACLRGLKICLTLKKSVLKKKYIFDKKKLKALLSIQKT